MSLAYSNVESNPPLPARDACDYDASGESFFHPGQGKPVIDGIVQVGAAHNKSFVVKLVAAYLG
jgi:hypothetical protein